MSFFDEIGKKITDAGRTAAEKAKDIAEVSHLNSVIKENDDRLCSLYCELGEMYFKAHRSDTSSEFAAKIKEISSVLAKTDEYRRSLLELKGLIKCPFCGAEFSEEESDCPKCGRAVPHKAQKIVDEQGESKLVCRVCGYHMRPDSNFCLMCGTPVEKDENADKEAPTTPDIDSHTDVKDEKTEDFSLSELLFGGTAEDKGASEDTADSGFSDNTSCGIVSDITDSGTSAKKESDVTDSADDDVRIFDMGIKNGEQAVRETDLDEIAARAAANISRITAEKQAEKSSASAFTPDNSQTKTDKNGAFDVTGAEAELPDFDSIDDGFIVEEQTLSDNPSAENGKTKTVQPSPEDLLRPDKTTDYRIKTTDNEKTPPVKTPVSRPSIGGKKCVKCGAPMRDNAVCCTKCGAYNERPANTNTVCPCCGAFVNSDMMFCPECGGLLK